jgi:hypothetical protein
MPVHSIEFSIHLAITVWLDTLAGSAAAQTDRAESRHSHNAFLAPSATICPHLGRAIDLMRVTSLVRMDPTSFSPAEILDQISIDEC